MAAGFLLVIAGVAGAQVPAKLKAQDFIPVRTSKGGLARYGLESGTVTYTYSGTVRGGRVIRFDNWGMRERTEDSIVSGSQNPQLNRNIISISTPDYFLKVNHKDTSFIKQPNPMPKGFQAMDTANSKSFGDEMLKMNFPERLPDTTIDGYKCRVYRRALDKMGSVITVCFWRGISVLEHVVIKNDSMDFTARAVTIRPNTGQLGSALLSGPKGYTDRSAPAPPAQGVPPGAQPNNQGMPPRLKK